MLPRLKRALDPLFRRFGLYASYELQQAEYIGPYVTDMDAARRWLRREGYHPKYLSASKVHPETGETHALSYARSPLSNHPSEAEGTALADYDPRQCAYHVHVFPDGDVFSHYELASTPYPVADEGVIDCLRRLRAHYRPTYDHDYIDRGEWTYLRGCSDLRI